MIEISSTFNEETNKVTDILDNFSSSVQYVFENSNSIKSKTQDVEDELQVNIGKIDHIILKVQTYKALFDETTIDIQDENSCRFGKWYSSISNNLLKGNSSLSSITKHHVNVHQGLRETLKLNHEAKYQEALNRIKDVENSSTEAFEILFDAVKSTQH